MAKFLWYLILLTSCSVYVEKNALNPKNISISQYVEIIKERKLIKTILLRNGNERTGSVFSELVLINSVLDELSKCRECRVESVSKRNYIEIIHTDGSVIWIFYSSVTNHILFNNKYYSCDVSRIMTLFNDNEL